jgi:hypothetical protein
MTVVSETLPSERTLLGALEAEARRAVTRAQQELAPIVVRETPRWSGTTASALRPKVRRTATGAALVIQAPRGARHPSGATVAQVMRWVTSGTGLYREGPGPKAPIRAKRGVRGNLLRRRAMILPGGKRVMSVRGQRPNPFIDRIRHIGDLRVTRTFEDGARQAARAVERVL